MVDPLIDSVVGQYQVLSRLGGGAMGIVYKARDTKLGRLVALKFLPPEWSHDEDAKQRFIREAQAASSTDHANICTVHDIQSTDDGRLFIVMAYYEGQTLKQRLAEGPVGVPDALDIATQIADGLTRAHAAGVIHRDIKPGNVIVTEDAVKIVDFGLATLAGSVQLTQAGSPMGTVAYMAPEQLRGLGATPASDVWAVGVILYELLAGHAPFQGAYAEAISYAIRHETPPPLRDTRPEVSEELEQLVFRALHKDPAVRFASGRELARALRQARGFSVPLELMTGPVHVPQRPAVGVSRRRLARRVGLGLAVLAAVVGVTFWYVTRPVPRTFIAIAPVANGTGDKTLDPYRLALTLELTRELAESRDVRVFPYTALLQPLRKFLTSGPDPSNTAAVQAVARASQAAVVIVPTLLYDSGALKARADLQDARGKALGRVETASLESSLTKDAAATLIGSLAGHIEQRLRSRRWTIARDVQPRRFGSLDAARAFEAGVNAYDVAEYAAARASFAAAAKEDPRHPLPFAWQSRVALVSGDRVAAAQAADLAEARLQATSPREALFVSAVVAEARRQDETAEREYRALAAAAETDPTGLIELAGFQDRSGRSADAIASYRRALDLASSWPLPALELCRLYNATRMNDAAQARQFGARARRAYAELGSSPGEALAMLCLADSLRVGKPEERALARELATQALSTFETLGLTYGLARAQHYVALAARAQGDLAAAALSWEQALRNAKAVGNTLLEATAYINLGVTFTALGQRGKAVEYYTQSYQTAERRGDERTAAYSRANAGALLIEYGDRPDEGLRFVEGALRVVQRLEDRSWEVFCLQFIAAHSRFTGRYAEARAGLAGALKIARDRQFASLVPALLLDDARVLIEMGDLAAARALIDQALGSEVATGTAELLIERARVDARLGDVDHAREMLAQARALPDPIPGDLVPRLHAVTGEASFAAGDAKQAYASFADAARLWTDDLPDAASVEARARVGLWDALAGKPAGRRAIETSLAQARRMQRPVLEAVARVLLAHLDLQARQPQSAAAVLEGVRMEAIGPELQARVRQGRAAAAAALGNDAVAQKERGEVARILAALQRNVPEALRARFLSRPDIQAMGN
jgi:tetratricopeptide (TPR) repeat protein